MASVRDTFVKLRLALWYALFLVITIALVGALLLAVLETNVLRKVDDALLLRALGVERTIAMAEMDSLTPDQMVGGMVDLAPLEAFSAPGIYVEIYDNRGQLLNTSPNLPGTQLPAPAGLIANALAGSDVFATVPAGGERVRLLARPILKHDQQVGVVVVGESMHMLDSTLTGLRQVLWISALAAALLSIMAGWWLRQRSMRPVADVTAIARRIASTGRFEQRIAVPDEQDELHELAVTFNEMLGRLETTFQRQREFLADASHELRGPLMVISGNLSLLQMPLSEDERRECVREATEEVQRMARLITDLLFLSEEDAQDRMERGPVALDRLLAAVYERACTFDAGAHQIVLTYNDPIVVLGDSDRLTQMVWNLVENALRYTDAGGRVNMWLRNYGRTAELVVSDTGIGIAAQHLRHIFERFYRVDRARSRNQGSTGLGLSIVKQVAEAHGGHVRVRSEPGSGTAFTVTLPVTEGQD